MIGVRLILVFVEDFSLLFELLQHVLLANQLFVCYEIILFVDVK